MTQRTEAEQNLDYVLGIDNLSNDDRCEQAASMILYLVGEAAAK